MIVSKLSRKALLGASVEIKSGVIGKPHPHAPDMGLITFGSR
jgi:hypothetical protein